MTAIVTSGSYFAERLGIRTPVAAMADNTTSVTAPPPNANDSVQLSAASANSYLLLRDTINEWASEVALVQVSDSDLSQITNYLSSIKEEYAKLSGLDASSSEYADTKAAIGVIEAEMSEFIGNRANLTSDLQVLYSKDGSFKERYFESLNLGDQYQGMQGSELAVLEVDMGVVLTHNHESTGCPICDSLKNGNGSQFSEMIAIDGAANQGLANDGLSVPLLDPNAAPASVTNNVTGAVNTASSGVSTIEPLRGGPIWDISPGETLSYSYYNGSVGYDSTAYSSLTYNAPLGASAISAANQALLDQAFEAWDTVLSFELEKVNESGSTVGELRSAYTTRAYASATSAAYAYFPNNSVVGGDIWYINDQLSNADFTPGTYGYLTALHEIGHALGLSHPFDGSSATGTTLASGDIQRNTVMTYTQTDRNYYFYDAGNGVGKKAFYASTPGIYDVAAIEYMYGVSTTSNTGNTTYTWNDSPVVIQTIVDSDGTDTIDASSQTRASTINLNPGTYSSIGIYTVADQLAHWDSVYNGVGALLNTSNLYTGVDNVGIAGSANIENAIGGAGADVITGNTLNNAIKGNQGNDTIDGGAGVNTAVFNGLYANYTITNNGGTITIVDNQGNDGTDTLTNIQFLEFSDFTYDVSSGATSTTPAGGAMAANNNGNAPNAGAGGSGGGSQYPGGLKVGTMHHLSGANISTQQGATMMIGIIDKAIEKVSSQRAVLGAMMNTLERQADALQTTLTNTEAAKSKIVDTDYATETTILARKTILAQAGQEMLQLSKQIDSQTVMSLLR